MCVTVVLAPADPSLSSHQVFLVSIGKAGARLAGHSEGMHQAAPTMSSSEGSHKAQWTGSGHLYAHSDPGILWLQCSQINSELRANVTHFLSPKCSSLVLFP